jgi:UDP-2,3-diacylglucosamine pyrophosphatase LpxH
MVCKKERRLIEAFLSDIHFPVHEQATWNLTLRLLKKINPDVIFLGGDIFDMLPIGSYLKSPEKAIRLQEDLDIGIAELRRLRQSFPSAKIYFKCGNHETRLTRFLFSRAAELAGLRKLHLRSLLDLDELDIEFIDNDEQFKIGELWHMHGNEIPVGSVYPARNLYLKVGVNVIFGHFHRESKYLDRAMDKKSRGAWGNSCMQTFDPEYLFHNQWTHGFHIVEYNRYGRFRVEPFTFFQEHAKECFVYQGKLMLEPMSEPKKVREHKL